MPPPKETWKTFGDLHSKSILQAATNNDEYKSATAQFHARLFLIVRGLSVDELHDMFGQALPPYLLAADGAERLHANRIFEDSHMTVENRMVERVRAYATIWLESAAGQDYQGKRSRAK